MNQHQNLFMSNPNCLGNLLEIRFKIIKLCTEVTNLVRSKGETHSTRIMEQY